MNSLPSPVPTRETPHSTAATPTSALLTDALDLPRRMHSAPLRGPSPAPHPLLDTAEAAAVEVTASPALQSIWASLCYETAPRSSPVPMLSPHSCRLSGVCRLGKGRCTLPAGQPDHPGSHPCLLSVTALTTCRQSLSSTHPASAVGHLLHLHRRQPGRATTITSLDDDPPL